jgi:hypothetical protein
MEKIKYNKKLNILGFIYLALKDHLAVDRKSLIQISCQYGGAYGITPKDVENALDQKLIYFFDGQKQKK